MNEADALRQCKKLRTPVNRGPGKDPHALSEALRIVETLRGSAAAYPRDRLAEIPDQLCRWFSVRRWREDSDPAGLRMRDRLMEDITMVEKTWRPASAPSAGCFASAAVSACPESVRAPDADRHQKGDKGSV